MSMHMQKPLQVISKMTDYWNGQISNPVYCRQLEDKSGFGVFAGTAKENMAASPNRGGRDRWEQCVGVGSTRAEAWKDYRTRK